MELNKKYIQKGLTHFNEFDKITPSQWEELVAQKTSPKALELSAHNTELAKRNKHHHHLGPSGYYAKEDQFRKMNNECLLKKVVHKKMRTCLNGNFERSI